MRSHLILNIQTTTVTKIKLTGGEDAAAVDDSLVQATARHRD